MGKCSVFLFSYFPLEALPTATEALPAASEALPAASGGLIWYLSFEALFEALHTSFFENDNHSLWGHCPISTADRASHFCCL